VKKDAKYDAMFFIGTSIRSTAFENMLWTGKKLLFLSRASFLITFSAVLRLFRSSYCVV
jgi:hypothetical protein